MNATACRQFPRTLILLWPLLLASLFAAPHLFDLANPGDFQVRNTVRLALVYWTIAIVMMLRDDPYVRIFWTLACTAYVVHVVVSFEHVHRWSHTAAFHHVEEASGYGVGIFVSYFFTLLWIADATWWWIARQSYRGRLRWVDWSIHGFMLFIIVNGAMIFENGPIRWVSAVVLVMLGVIWFKKRQRAPLAMH